MSSWRDNLRYIEPYVPGEQPDLPDMVKLNTNENPYPPSPKVAQVIKDFDSGTLRLYPDPGSKALADAIARRYKIASDEVFTGVGSDDVLAIAFMTFFNSKKPILFPDITYSFYDVWADLYRIPYKTCALDGDFHICPQDYKRPNGGVIFPNPNAPTGVYEPLKLVEEIVEANRDVVVIVDEAYIDFGGESALPLIQKYDNLLVVQTFSKSRAMAGMRIGFAMGNEKLIRYLSDAKFSFNSYTMNRPALTLGAEALKDRAYFEEITGRIVTTRERVKGELKKLGFMFPDSLTNFIFATHERIPAARIFQALRERNIYVRHWDKPRISDYLRITVGTDEEMDTLLSFLREYI